MNVPDRVAEDGDAQELIRLARAAAHDTAAMTLLVRRTSPLLWRTCAALVDRSAADDLTQETYLRALRSLHSFRGDSSPVRWLLTIARRVCAEEIATRQRDRVALAGVQRRITHSDCEPTALVDLADAIDRLCAERREAFLLTAVAGLPYADAAAICDCPIGTIRSRVARARDDLIHALTIAPSPRQVMRASGA